MYAILVAALSRWRLELISRLRLRLEFMVLLEHGALDVIVQQFKSGEFGGHAFFLKNPRQFA